MQACREPSASESRGHVAYLCLQPTRQGQASYAHVNEIVAGLRKIGWRVDLHEPSFDNARELPGLLGRALELCRVQIAMLSALTKSRPDLLYVRFHYAAFPICFWARLLRIPSVQEVNGPFDDLFVAWPQVAPLRRLLVSVAQAQLRWARAIVVMTEPYRNWVNREVGEKRVEVIPNGANTDMFFPKAACDEVLPSSFALFFGALAAWQGLPDILRALDSPHWPTGVSLVVLGQGTGQAQVEQAAANDPRILYLGNRPYRDMPGIIGRAMISLSPQVDLKGRASLGLCPLKVFESLACGVPILVTDFPGQADLVREHECGWVVAPGDSEGIARAVAACADEPEIAAEMGRRGHIAIREFHSWAARARQTDRLLLASL